jgi:hypothetical protein
MSWSIGAKGTKEDVKKNLDLQSQSPLGAYAGKPEADDIKAALERCHALVDALVLGDNGYGVVADGVQVSAYGSHSTGPNGITAGSFSVAVNAVKLDG